MLSSAPQLYTQGRLDEAAKFAASVSGKVPVKKATNIVRATVLLGTLVACLPGHKVAAAQVLIRLGDSTRANYSELHEGLRDRTPAADSVRRMLNETKPARLWQVLRQALSDRRSWNDGLLALTRLAELRSPAFADSARRMIASVEDEKLRVPPGRAAWDLLQPLRAIVLELERGRTGDSALRREILARVPTAEYGLAEAWVLGRMGPPTADSIRSRFLAAPDGEQKVRYLTLLTFSSDTSSIHLLGRVFAAPDSFGVPLRYGSRASDALLWIGTRNALATLKHARGTARTRRTYADPQLMRGGFDFLANDSAAAVARTGQTLESWLLHLP